MRLGELQVGETGRILMVGGEGALRRRLLDMGLTPHTVVGVRKLAPMGDPMQLTLRGYELTLRKEDADKITVESLFTGKRESPKKHSAGAKEKMLRSKNTYAPGEKRGRK